MSSNVNLKLLIWNIVDLSCKVLKLQIESCKFKTFTLKSCKFKLYSFNLKVVNFNFFLM
jgi:hypothetical protein